MPEDRSVLARSAPAPDRSWPYGTAEHQIADEYLPAAGAAGLGLPPVLLVHGGFWRPEYDRAHLRSMAAALAALGYPTVLPEYSRSPGRPDDAVADLRAARDALDRAVDGSEPVIVGHSAGGHLALLLAADPSARLRGCLALAPVADLSMAEERVLDQGAVRAFLGTSAAERADVDPVRGPRPDIPVTVIHGDQDSLVPIALSQSYCASGFARLVTVSGTGHFELIDPLSHAWAGVIGELSSLAAPTGIE